MKYATDDTMPYGATPPTHGPVHRDFNAFLMGFEICPRRQRLFQFFLAPGWSCGYFSPGAEHRSLLCVKRQAVWTSGSGDGADTARVTEISFPTIHPSLCIDIYSRLLLHHSSTPVAQERLQQLRVGRLAGEAI